MPSKPRRDHVISKHARGRVRFETDEDLDLPEEYGVRLVDLDHDPDPDPTPDRKPITTHEINTLILERLDRIERVLGGKQQRKRKHKQRKQP